MPRHRKTLRVPGGKSFLRPTRIARGQHGDRWFDGPNVVRVATLNGLQDRLHGKGWNRIGGGVYGFAMGKGNLVWKCTNEARFDEGYKRFAWGVINRLFPAWCMPKIKLVLVADDGSYALLMERLTTLGFNAPYETQRRVEGSRWAAPGRPEWSDPLSQVVAKIVEFGRMWGFGNDLHGGNWMLRRDGSVVITDPLS